jgi:hypothetical protein
LSLPTEFLFIILKFSLWSWAWYDKHEIPELRRLLQENHEFRASLGYIVRSQNLSPNIIWLFYFCGGYFLLQMCL